MKQQSRQSYNYVHAVTQQKPQNNCQATSALLLVSKRAATLLTVLEIYLKYIHENMKLYEN